MSDLWYDAHRHNSFDYTRELILYNYGEDLQVLRERIKELEKCGEHRQDIIEILEKRVEELELWQDIGEAHREKYMAENQRLTSLITDIHEKLYGEVYGWDDGSDEWQEMRDIARKALLGAGVDQAT